MDRSIDRSIDAITGVCYMKFLVIDDACVFFFVPATKQTMYRKASSWASRRLAEMWCRRFRFRSIGFVPTSAKLSTAAENMEVARNSSSACQTEPSPYRPCAASIEHNN